MYNSKINQIFEGIVSEKLQQAIANIKSGNKNQGQQLLAQILQTEPNNETAWLWMSAVVDEDKRKYCIERVLKINPNNEVAKQALENLNKIESKIPLSPPQLSIQNPPAPNKDTPSKKNLKESPLSAPVTSIIFKNSIPIGIICGILEFPLAFIILFTGLIFPPFIVFLLLFLMQVISGTWAGINLLRAGIGDFRMITTGGAISGFTSGAVFYLLGGFWFINSSMLYPFVLTPSAYILLCGFIIPSVLAIANTITVWIPRMFINPNWKEEETQISKKTIISKNNPPVVLKEIHTETKSGKRFWISSGICVFFLENEFLFGIIPPESSSRFEESISNENIDFNLLNSKTSFLFTQISEVTKQKSVITIEWVNQDNSKHLEIKLNNESEANAVFNELHQRTSGRLEKTTTALETINVIVKYGSVLAGILIFSVIAYISLGYTSFTWVRSVAGEYSGEVEDFIRFFVRGGGVIIIGGIPFITTLGLMLYKLLQPPITKLKSQESNTEKLKNAIKYIKSGNIQQGHSLLTQIVKEEPNNEEAWFWIASISLDNKKQIYLEKVLEINPNNQQAIVALEVLKTKDKVRQVEIVQPKSEPVFNVSNKESEKSLVVQKFWIHPTRKELFIFLLSEDKLLTAKSNPKFTGELTKQLSVGNIPYSLLTEKITVPIKNLINIEESLNSLKINFQDENSQVAIIRMECKDEQMSSEIFSAIEQNSPSLFERKTMQMSKGKIILSNSIVLSIILGLSAFLYYGALEIESGAVNPTGSSRVRGLIALLDVIGTSGVICIGGVLFLVVLFSMILSLRKPPLVTTLTQKEPIQPKSITNQQKEKDKQASTNVQSPEIKYSNLLSAALSDGLYTGLIGGILCAILPILFIFLKSDAIFGLSLVTSIVIIFSVGAATGNLYYERNLPRGTWAVNFGGGLSGFITGSLCGIIYGFLFYTEGIEGDMAQNQSRSLYAFSLLFFCFPAFASSVIGALMAGVPSLFIKNDPSIKDFDWRDGKSEIEIAQIENRQKQQKNRFRSRLIFSGIAILLAFISAICRSLAS